MAEKISLNGASIIDSYIVGMWRAEQAGQVTLEKICEPVVGPDKEIWESKATEESTKHRDFPCCIIGIWGKNKGKNRAMFITLPESSATAIFGGMRK